MPLYCKPLVFLVIYVYCSINNEWKDNVESKGMRVNLIKTKVMISGERQMVRQKDVRWPAGSAVKVSVAIHYSVLDARNGSIRNVVVYRIACRKWQSHSFAEAA